jgi:NTP pyrophosphatase (non-canonical NTP hydrolase)
VSAEMNSKSTSVILKQEGFKDLVDVLQMQAYSDSQRWFPNAPTQDLVYHALGITDELGEMVGIIKKIHRGDYTLEQAMDPEFMKTKGKEPLDVEVVDAFFYILNILELLGKNLYEVYEAKRQVNNKRWNDVEA